MKYYLIVYLGTSELKNGTSVQTTGNLTISLSGNANKKIITDTIIDVNQRIEGIKTSNVVVLNIIKMTKQEFNDWTDEN